MHVIVHDTDTVKIIIIVYSKFAGVGGGDYRLISSTVNISTGLSMGEVSMEISEDSIVEGVEVITLAMSSGVVPGVTGGKTLVDTVDQYTTVLIEDNNSKKHFKFILIVIGGDLQLLCMHLR